MSAPDSLPADLREQTPGQLMVTLQRFCLESSLPRVAIVGALEAVKHEMLTRWFAEDEDDA